MKYSLVSETETHIAVKIDIECLTCVQCNQYAIEPLVYPCCSLIICRQCFKSNICLKCSQENVPTVNKFVIRLFQSILIQCPFGCPHQIIVSSIVQHAKICANKCSLCTLCKDTIQNDKLIQHMFSTHREACERMILEIHNGKKQVQKAINMTQSMQQSIYKSAVKQQKKKNPLIKFQNKGSLFFPNLVKINAFGKTCCGNARGDKKVKNFSFFSNEATCGSKGNCNQCMKQDIDRFQLPKGYLLNLLGRVCKFQPTTKTLHCNAHMQSQNCQCSIRKSCQSCQQLGVLINEQKLYHDFI